MTEWMAIAQWHECEKMTRPGIVFELKNAEGLTLLTPCASDGAGHAVRLEIAAGHVSRGGGAQAAALHAHATAQRLTSRLRRVGKSVRSR